MLAPIATLASTTSARGSAGRLAGLCARPRSSPRPTSRSRYFVHRYHDTWVDQFLPQALGLTQQADFPSIVAVLVAAALTVRALAGRRAPRGASSPGRSPASRSALKPANALFLGGPLLALLLARRLAHVLLFARRARPGARRAHDLEAGASARSRSSRRARSRLAAGLGDPVAASATSLVRPHRPPRTSTPGSRTCRTCASSPGARGSLQFLPLAGALAVARRSVPAAGLFLAWLLGYVVVKGAASVATIESGSYWRLVMPALPAFVLLTAAVPLLVPTLVDRMGPRLAPLPGRRPGLRPTVAVVAFLAVVPIAVLLVVRPLRARRAADPAAWVRLPAGDRRRDRRAADAGVVSLAVRRSGDANVLAWTDSTKRARTFYRVYRGLAVERVPRHGLRAARRRPLRAPRGDARRHARPAVRRPESARRTRSTGSASRRTGSTTRAGRRLRDQPTGRAVRRMSVTSQFRTAVAIVPVYLALCVFSEGGLITDSLWGDVGHYEGFGAQDSRRRHPVRRLQRGIPAVRAAGIRRSGARDVDRTGLPVRRSS